MIKSCIDIFNYLIFETYRLLRIFPIFPLFSKHWCNILLPIENLLLKNTEDNPLEEYLVISLVLL